MLLCTHWPSHSARTMCSSVFGKAEEDDYQVEIYVFLEVYKKIIIKAGMRKCACERHWSIGTLVRAGAPQMRQGEWVGTGRGGHGVGVEAPAA